MMEEYLEFAKHVAFYAGDLMKKILIMILK